MRTQHIYFGLMSVALTTSLLAQTIVSGGGPAVQNAIAAAAVGDTLIVQAGTYDPVVVDKGLTVICEPGVGFTNTVLSISVQINTVPAGQSVRWFGGEMLPSTPKGEFRVFFCDGTVEVEGVVSQACVTNDSLQTSFTDCDFSGRTAVDNSVVTFAKCYLHRLQSCVGALCSSLEVIDGSTVLVIDTGIVGPLGLSPIFPPNPGLYVDDSTVRLTGVGTFVSSGGVTIPAIAVGPSGATIDQDPLAIINGAIAGGSASVMTIPAISTAGGSSGQAIPLTTYGQPGSFAFSVVGLPMPRVATPFGDLWMLPPGVVVSSGIVPANGQLPGSFTVPAGAFGLSLTFQSVGLLLNSSFLIGPPTVVIYR